MKESSLTLIEVRKASPEPCAGGTIQQIVTAWLTAQLAHQ